MQPQEKTTGQDAPADSGQNPVEAAVADTAETVRDATGIADTPSESAVEAQPLRWETVVEQWDRIAIPAATLVGAVILATIVCRIAITILRRISRKSTNTLDESLIKALAKPAGWILPLLAAQMVLNSVRFTGGLAGLEGIRAGLRHAVAIGLIATLTWAITRLVRWGVNSMLRRYDVSVADNREARRVHTQIGVITRILSAVIWIIGISIMLMTFDSIRHLGTSVLASAGIAGLIVGLAAQQTIGNFLAGLQIALTQPISMDDVVVMEGEWGRVEEITSTYVVVKIWDDRRLIVPFSSVIGKPFTNWTRKNSQILGTAFIYVDYTVPIDEVRAELERYVQTHDKWDKRAWGLQVTDLKERTVELRALVSAADAGQAFDLRCDVREHLIKFISREYPGSLPRTRLEGELDTPALMEDGKRDQASDEGDAPADSRKDD